MDNLSLIDEAKKHRSIFDAVGGDDFDIAPEMLEPQYLSESSITPEVMPSMVPGYGGENTDDLMDYDFSTPGMPESEMKFATVQDPKTRAPVRMDTETLGAYQNLHRDIQGQGVDPASKVTLNEQGPAGVKRARKAREAARGVPVDINEDQHLAEAFSAKSEDEKKALFDPSRGQIIRSKDHLAPGDLVHTKGAVNVKAQTQSNAVSCGQTSCAVSINALTGKNLTDKDINDKYGFRLLDSLNAESEGYQWSDKGNLSSESWGTVESSVKSGMPVMVALNGPEFSASGRGHIVTIKAIKGDKVLYADPADGSEKVTTKQAMLSAPQHPDGNFIFAATPKGGESVSTVGVYTGEDKIAHRPVGGDPKESTFGSLGEFQQGIRPNGPGNPNNQPYQIRINPGDKETRKRAIAQGFVPVEGDSGLMSYMGIDEKVEDEGIPSMTPKNIPLTELTWTPEKEEALRISMEEGLNPDIVMNVIDAKTGWTGKTGEDGVDSTTSTIDNMREMLAKYGNYPQALAALKSGPKLMKKVLEGAAEIPIDTIKFVKKAIQIPNKDLVIDLIKNYKDVREKALTLSKHSPDESPSPDSWYFREHDKKLEDAGGIPKSFLSTYDDFFDDPETSKLIDNLDTNINNVYTNNREMHRGIADLTYSTDATAPAIKNAAIRQKEDASRGVVSTFFSFINPIRTTTDPATYGQTFGMAKSAMSMATDLLPQNKIMRLFGLDPGADIEESMDRVADAIGSAVLSKPTHETFTYGKDIGSIQIKRFANLLHIGGMGFGKTDGRGHSFSDFLEIAQGKKDIWGNGQYLTKSEQKTSEQFATMFHQQGGLVSSTGPLAGTKAEKMMLDFEIGFAENPFAPLGLMVQMQAATALAGTKGLVAASKATGFQGSLARGVTNVLNFLGQAGGGAAGAATAAGKASKGTLGRFLSSPFIKAEVAMGIFGGTEAFRDSFALRLGDDNTTAGEALWGAIGDGAYVAGIGLALGMGSKAVGVGVQASTTGAKRAGKSIMDRPSMATTKGYMENISANLSKIPLPSRLKSARAALAKLDKETRDTFESHAEGMAEQVKSVRYEDNVRANAKQNHDRKMDVAEYYQKEKVDTSEIMDRAKGELKVLEDEHVKLQTRADSLLDADDAPISAIADLDRLAADKVRLKKELQQVDAELTQAKQDKTNPDARAYAVEKLKEKAAIWADLGEATDQYTKINKEEVQPYLDSKIDQTGGRVSHTKLRQVVATAKRKFDTHPAQKIVAGVEEFQRVQRAQDYAIDMLHQQAAKDKALADGHTVVPDNPPHNYAWLDPEEEMTAFNIRNYVEQSSEEVLTAMPWEMKVKLDTLIQESAQGSLFNEDGFKKFNRNLNSYVKKIKDPVEKAFYEERVAEMQGALTEARNRKATMTEVANDVINPGPYRETIRGLLKAASGGDDSALDRVSPGTLGELMAQDEAVSRSLAAKMGLRTVDESKQGLQGSRTQLQAEGLLEKPDDLVQQLGTELHKLHQNEESFNAQLNEAAPDLKVDMNNPGAVRGAVENAVLSLRAKAEGLVAGSAKHMVAARKAFNQLATMGRAVSSHHMKKGMDNLNTRIAESTTPLSADPTLKAFIKSERNAKTGRVEDVFDEDLFNQYVTDTLFEGGDKLTKLMKEVPEIREALSTVLHLDGYLKSYDLFTPDMKGHANELYVGDFLPRTRMYQEVSGGSFPKELLKGEGIVDDKGKLQISLAALTDKANAAESALGGKATWEEFLNMETHEQARVLRESGHATSVDGQAEVSSVVAGLLVGDRIKSPGELVQSRIKSIGNAESQRKFVDRMATYRNENGSPLIYVKDIHGGDRPPEDHIRLSQTKAIQTKSYTIHGADRKAADIWVDKDAAKLIDDYYVEISRGKADDNLVELVRLQNALALGGSHLPYLSTIGTNMWQVFGFNMAKLSKAMHFDESFDGINHFESVVKDAQNHGLEVNTFENNALAMAQDFKKSNPKLYEQLGKDLEGNPQMWESLAHEAQKHIGDIRKSKGVREGVFKVVSKSAKGARDFDEWLMEHFLFSNLKNAQIAAWSVKAQQFEAQIKLDGTASGMTPTEIRSMAKRQASEFINTFSGTVNQGSFGSFSKKMLRLTAMTPQFFGARINSIRGAFRKETFKGFPEASQARLRNEHMYMLGRMGAVAGASTFLLQYLINGTTPLDNGEGNMFSVDLGNGFMVTNPLSAYINTVSKLTGTQEMARGIGNAMREQASKSDTLAQIPGMKPSAINLPTTSGTIGTQIGSQFTNLMSPFVKGFANTERVDAGNKYDPFVALESLKKTIISDVGMIQFLTGRDPWTGVQQEPWQRVLSQSGVFVKKSSPVRNYTISMEQSKTQAVKGLRENVRTTLRAAWKIQDPVLKRKKIEEAWRMADPMDEYEDGGVKVGKHLRKAFYNHPNMGRNGQLKLSIGVWENLLFEARNPDLYQRSHSSTVLRPAVDEALKQKAESKAAMREMGERTGTGSLTEAVRGL